MARPKTIDEFLSIKEAIDAKYDGQDKEIFGNQTCRSCSGRYRSIYRNLTEGHCPGCAAELFYGSVSVAAVEMLQEQDTKSRREWAANDSLVPRQRAKLGHAS